MDLTINWGQSFDSTTALASMFLWLLFGYLSTQVNCDLQRLLTHSILVKHMVSLLAFFFLFTLIDSNNKSNLITTWVKTVVVYVLFILTTKSKWYFIIPVLALLLIDQSLKKYIKDSKENDTIEPAKKRGFDNASKFINVVIIVIIIVGAIHYAALQKAEYKGAFSWYAFFVGTTKPCKKYAMI